MRIMEIVSGQDVNGPVMHCMQLSKKLAERGHQVWVVCRHGSWIGKQLTGTPDITIVESDMRRWPFDELRRIASLAKSVGIEVTHTHMSRAHNFGVFLRRFGVLPCIATAHSHKVLLHWRFADHIIAVSDMTRNYHLKRNRISPGRIETIHHFTDAARFSAVDPSCRTERRQSMGIADHHLLIGQIGDILPRKGQIYLIRAMPGILKAIPNARLILAGHVRHAGYMRRVEAEIVRQGVTDQVIWLGFSKDVPQLLDALDVFVLASLDEMFPGAVIEAMAIGKPVVTTRVGGIPECVPEPGAALLVEPRNPDALADAIVEMLCNADIRQELGENAKRTVLKHFTIDVQVPKIEAVFEKVIRQTKAIQR